jgi:hypothetical protein
MAAGAQPAPAESAVEVGEQVALAAPRRPAARRLYLAHVRLSVPPLAATAPGHGPVCCHKAGEVAVARAAARDQAAERDREEISARVPEPAPVPESGIGLEPAIVLG